MSGFVGTYLHMDEALKKRIASEAKSRGMTQRALIHTALTAYLDGDDAEANAAPRQEQLPIGTEEVPYQKAS